MALATDQKERKQTLEKQRRSTPAGREYARLRSAAWRAANLDKVREANRVSAAKRRALTEAKARTPEQQQKQREASERYRKNKPVQQAAATRRWWLKKTYGLDMEQYNNMFEAQAGYCALCGKHQTTLSRRLAVDHDHRTGAVRGLLCGRCNTSLERFEAADWIEKALAYLGRK
jgi:hypothetical protein